MSNGHDASGDASSHGQSAATSSPTRCGFLEAEVTDLRRRLSDAPAQTRGLELRLADTQRSLVGRHRPERAARPDPARGARPDHDAQGGGRPAGPAAGRLRHLPRPQRRRHRRRVHRRPQAARQRQPRRRRSTSLRARPGGHAQRGAQRRRGPRLRAGRRGRHAQGDPRRTATAPWSSANADEERVVRLADAAAATSTLRAGDSLLLDTRSGYVYERMPEVRGRGARPRRGPRHRLRRRSAASPTRSSRSATPSSCPTCTPTCSTSTSSSRPRASCSTARPAAARR